MRGGLVALVLIGLAAGLYQLERYAAVSGVLSPGSAQRIGERAVPARPPAVPRPAPGDARDTGRDGGRDGVTVTLFGASLFLRGAWIGQLQASLSACSTAGPVRVRTVARAGASSAWGLTELGAALAGSDAVVVNFIVNDASLWRGVPLRASAANHAAILAAARDAGVPVFLADLGPVFSVKKLARPGLERYRAALGALAAGQGAGVIDARAAWSALSPAERAQAIPDGLHPTDAAMARINLPVLLAALRPLVCGDPP